MLKHFARVHPVLQVLIYGVLLGWTLILEHPASLLLAWSGVCLALRPIRFEGPRQGLKTVLLPFIFALPTALLNALFRHYGMIHLFTWPWGSAVSLEVLADGAQAGFRLGLAFLWFKHLYLYLETDRLLFLFSRLPNFALLLTLILRFLPRFSKEAAAISACQKLRFSETKARLPQKLKAQSELLGGLSAWGMESSIRTADAMLARGLDLPIKRTRYRLYRWRLEDTFLALLFGLLCLSSFYLLGNGALKALFFPVAYLPSWGKADILCFILTGMISFLPFLIDLGGTLRWNLSRLRA